MSKHSRKKARRRKHGRKPVLVAMCQNCGSTYPATAEARLTALAEAMNACQDAGLRVRLQHGIVKTREGYVVQLMINDRWVARTMTYTEFSPALVGDDDDLDD